MKSEKMETEIFEIIPKYLEKTASIEEIKTLEAWLEESQDHREIFDRSRVAWESTPSLDDKKQFSAHQDWEKVASRLKKERPLIPTRRILYVAASIAAFLISGFFLLNQFTISQDEVVIRFTNNESTPVEYRLLDESTVWLNPNSSLNFSQTEDVRDVSLSGRAYFEVTHDKHKPFIIHTERATVQVLGTAFSLSDKLEEEEVMLSVTEGKVSFKPRLSEESVLVEKGNQAFISNSRVVVEELDENYLAWKTGEVTFENESLGEAIDLLTHQFSVEIKISNPATKSCRFSAQFSGQSIHEILEVIAITLNLELNTTPNGYQLVGNACN